MIQIRKRSGEVIPVTEGCAIEVVDVAGNLGIVVIQQPGGSIHILTPGDPLFNAHLILTKQRQSKVVIHEPSPPPKKK